MAWRQRLVAAERTALNLLMRLSGSPRPPTLVAALRKAQRVRLDPGHPPGPHRVLGLLENVRGALWGGLEYQPRLASVMTPPWLIGKPPGPRRRARQRRWAACARARPPGRQGLYLEAETAGPLSGKRAVRASGSDGSCCSYEFSPAEALAQLCPRLRALAATGPAGGGAGGLRHRKNRAAARLTPPPAWT